MQPGAVDEMQKYVPMGRWGRPEELVGTAVFLASSPDVAGVTGHYFDKCKAREPNRAAREDGASARLWAISEELTSGRAESNAA